MKTNKANVSNSEQYNPIPENDEQGKSGIGSFFLLVGAFIVVVVVVLKLVSKLLF